VFGGGLEDVADELDRLLGIAQDVLVEEMGTRHQTPLPFVRTSFKASRITSGSNGRRRNFDAPRATPFSTSRGGGFVAETKITGVSRSSGSRRTFSMRSNPSPSDMWRSEMIACGRARRARSSAALPLTAISTSYPE